MGRGWRSLLFAEEEPGALSPADPSPMPETSGKKLVLGFEGFRCVRKDASMANGRSRQCPKGGRIEPNEWVGGWVCRNSQADHDILGGSHPGAQPIGCSGGEQPQGSANPPAQDCSNWSTSGGTGNASSPTCRVRSATLRWSVKVEQRGMGKRIYLNIMLI